MRKPLGSLGAANALPYAHTQRAPLLLRACAGFDGFRARVRLATNRCWAWKFGANYRAFEFGAHDFGVTTGMGDFETATVRLRKRLSANVPHCSSSVDSCGLKLAGPKLHIQQRYPTAAPGGHRDRRPANECLPGRREKGQHNASTIDHRLRGRCARTRQRRQHSPDICAVRPCMACGRVRALRSACLSLMARSQCCNARSRASNRAACRHRPRRACILLSRSDRGRNQVVAPKRPNPRSQTCPLPRHSCPHTLGLLTSTRVANSERCTCSESRCPKSRWATRLL